MHICLACTYFYLGMYQEAEKSSEKADKDQLKTRIRFHLAHKFGDEKKLMSFHQELEDVIEDQLSLASIHYLRSHYQEAIDIYKRYVGIYMFLIKFEFSFTQLFDNLMIINFKILTHCVG